MQTPVVLVVFRRPDVTARVLEEVAKAKPPKLFIIADGPRLDRSGESQLCAETRALFNQVDWDCEVHRNFADTNMGLNRRVADGLAWVFDLVEEAIVFEDDCLPDPSFFPFCDELLERYRHDTRIMQIAGTNFQQGYQRTADSYYFSRYPTSTGWASWRRAWRYFDLELNQWPAFRDGGWLFDWLPDERATRGRAQDFDRMYATHPHRWEACWRFALWTQGAYSVTPNVNLITNLGYRTDGTHTTGENWLSRIRSHPIALPLQHPQFIIPDTQADRFLYYARFGNGLLERGYGKAWRLWRTFRHRGRLRT